MSGLQSSVTVRRTLMGALAMGLALGAQPASAAVMLMTRTSVISSVEGSASGDLIGQTVTMSLKYDTAKGRYTRATSGSAFSFLERDGDSDPLLAFNFTVGGRSYAITSPDRYFSLVHTALPGFDDHEVKVLPPRDDDNPQFYFRLRGLAPSEDILMPLDLTAAFDAVTADTGELSIQLSGGEFATFNLGDGETRNGSIRVREFEPNAVPEPGAWALMIMGFALAGATLRRRTSAVA